MNVVIGGASGLVGSVLADSLARQGHEVRRLVRSHGEVSEGEIPWDPAAGDLDSEALNGVDGVVCLSGESIASLRWTEKKKKAIHDSRVDSAGLLARTMAGMETPPSVFVCASAMGYYGMDRGDTVLTEDSTAGHDFLARVCVDWEKAADPAREHGVRVVHARFGAILSARGGALQRMAPAFKLGLGGVLGSGDQYFSWLTVDDAAGIIAFALGHVDLRGPVNAVSPNPVTNREFTETLGKVLHRPTLLPVPAVALKTLLGEMGDALMLSSYRLMPKKLEESGYSFVHPHLEGALRELLEC